MNLDPFKTGDALNPKSNDDIFTKPKAGGGGGMGRTRKPESAAEPLDIPIEPVAPEPEKPKPTVVLRNPKWEIEKVGFNEETDISVELDLPKEHAHKTRVTFELFAKTPKGPERMLQCEGHAEVGKAKCRIPVYIPKYKDADGNSLQKVEYYFTAKHSESALLDGSKAPKIIDEMAERLIESHILPDLTFAFDKSFLHPKHAAALKDMCAKIKAWREKNPDGKLAVFGHADAVGKEDYNKALSERRAKSVFAFLMKDAGAWSDLDKEEKWGLACIQDLLKHLGHDPGASDGQDGPKTQAAVKEFQTKKSLPVDGQAGASTRKALYQAFMDDCNTLSLKAKDFDVIDGKSHTGCSEFNLVEKTEGASQPNRRVAVFLLKSNKNFPINYPCKQGEIGPCKTQKAKKGERRTPGFSCFFYDNLVTENANAGEDEDNELPDYNPGKVEDPNHVGCDCGDIYVPPGADKPSDLANIKWSVETAVCGDDIKLEADSKLPDGTPVQIKLSTKAGICEEATVATKTGKLEFAWKVKHIGFGYQDDKKPMKVMEVEAELEHGGEKSSPDKKLQVTKLVDTPAEVFDKSYTWGQYSVHSHFTQAMKGEWQKVIVKKKVMKTWGGTYVKLKKAGITGVGGDFPWADHRWARAKKGEMFPNEYWDGKAWKAIPASAALGGADFGTLPLIQKGGKVVWVSSDSAIWPDPVEDYKHSDYEAKRQVWIKDSHKRWTGVWKVKRKACTATKDKPCCSYEVWLDFEMDLVDTFGNDVLCLAPGSLRSNAGLMFYGETRVAMAAHEVGHLVGLPDEYVSGAVDPAVNADGAVNGIDGTTLMGSSLNDESNNKIKTRHYSNFLAMARTLHQKNGGKDEEWVVESKA
jgi:outer membrane protein OmpA-like peptidoglycan-associated protein